MLRFFGAVFSKGENYLVSSSPIFPCLLSLGALSIQLRSDWYIAPGFHTNGILKTRVKELDFSFDKMDADVEGIGAPFFSFFYGRVRGYCLHIYHFILLLYFPALRIYQNHCHHNQECSLAEHPPLIKPPPPAYTHCFSNPVCHIMVAKHRWGPLLMLV